MKDLKEKDLRRINGGTNCPSDYNADQYEARLCNGAILWGIIVGFCGF